MNPIDVDGDDVVVEIAVDVVVVDVDVVVDIADVNVGFDDVVGFVVSVGFVLSDLLWRSLFGRIPVLFLKSIEQNFNLLFGRGCNAEKNFSFSSLDNHRSTSCF